MQDPGVAFELLPVFISKAKEMIVVKALKVTESIVLSLYVDEEARTFLNGEIALLKDGKEPLVLIERIG